MHLLLSPGTSEEMIDCAQGLLTSFVTLGSYMGKQVVKRLSEAPAPTSDTVKKGQKCMHPHYDVFEIPCLKKINKWCVVQFSSGATEIVPNTWVEGDKVFWPPYPTKDSIRMNAAVLNREQPGHGWHTYQPIRLLITRDSHDEAARSLDRYVNKDCDTTDIQSEEESHHGLKRKRRPNPIYHSDEEPRNERRFAQAPKVLFPDVAMQKLLTAVTELSKEVKDLREEFRLFRQSCRCGQSDCVGLPLAEPLEVPLHTMEALDRAEETLQNGTNRQTMVVV
ncbi:unnamed protein product [Leuciscus chuanchicus]